MSPPPFFTIHGYKTHKKPSIFFATKLKRVRRAPRIKRPIPVHTCSCNPRQAAPHVKKKKKSIIYERTLFVYLSIVILADFILFEYRRNVTSIQKRLSLSSTSLTRSEMMEPGVCFQHLFGSVALNTFQSYGLLIMLLLYYQSWS